MGGEILENPVTTERVEVLVSTEESGGERLPARFSLRPRGGVAGTHYHPTRVQTFEVESGTLSVRVGSTEFSLAAGETATVPAGVAHDQWNESDEVVYAIEELRPALNFLEVLRVVFALARAGKTDAKGRPGLLMTSAITAEYSDCFCLGSPLLRALVALLAPVSSMLGYRAQVRALARENTPAA